MLSIDSRPRFTSDGRSVLDPRNRHDTSASFQARNFALVPIGRHLLHLIYCWYRVADTVPLDGTLPKAIVFAAPKLPLMNAR